MIVLAGLVQLAVALSSIAIPRLLGWRQEVAVLKPLTRRIFWTYSGYILGIHIWFALVSIFCAAELTGGSRLAAFVTGFISLYWLVRVIGQFTWYDRSIASTRLLFRLAEIAYVTAFTSLTIVYGWAAVGNVWAS